MLITFIFVHYCDLHFVFKDETFIFSDHILLCWASTVLFWAFHL